MDKRPSVALVSSSYAAAALLFIVTAIDLFMRLRPVRNNLNWRLGAVGMVSIEAPTLLLAVLIVALSAAFLGHRGFLRLVSAASLFVALTVVVVVGLFALDVQTFFAMTPEEGRATLLMTMGRAGIALILTGVALAWIGIAGWRESRARGHGSKKSRDTSSGTIVSATSSTPAQRSRDFPPTPEEATG